jgi:hypothetical protein
MQYRDAGGVIGPRGYRLRSCPGNGKPALACVDLYHADPDLDVASNKAWPWRARARAGEGPWVAT